MTGCAAWRKALAGLPLSVAGLLLRGRRAVRRAGPAAALDWRAAALAGCWPGTGRRAEGSRGGAARRRSACRRATGPMRRAQGAPERSTDFPWLHAARRASTAGSTCAAKISPVHFFNDAARFNFGPDVQPGRDQLPFSRPLAGLACCAPSDGERRFVVESTGPASVALDDAAAARRRQQRVAVGRTAPAAASTTRGPKRACRDCA